MNEQTNSRRLNNHGEARITSFRLISIIKLIITINQLTEIKTNFIGVVIDKQADKRLYHVD